MKKKILLIDGHSIINRAFYGLPDFTDSTGRHTGAVYGFLNILIRFIDEEQPAAMAVAFDVHAPTFRHDIFPEYKGKRKPMPEELREQIPLLKEVLDTMGIKRIEKAGLEADDLLGTIAVRSAGEGYLATIVSGDRDLLQVAAEDIIVALPRTKSGQTTITRYNAEAVREEWGVSGERFIELKALMGDTSDNIPGLPKVGEKTAKDLMMQFGSGDAIFERSSEITKKALRENVETNRDLYELSKTLATINCHADVEFDIESAAMPENGFAGYMNEETRELFRKLGFRNLLSRFAEDKAGSGEKGSGLKINRAADRDAAAKVFDEARSGSSDYIGISLICDRNDKEIIPFGFALCSDGETASFIDMTAQEYRELVRRGLDGLSSVKKIAVFGAKEAYRFFTPARILFDEDRELPQVFDVKIASYLLDPLKSDIAPEDVAQAHAGLQLRSRQEIFGKSSFSARPDEAAAYAAELARSAFLAAPALAEKLENAGELGLFNEIEMPLSYILYDMERLGIRTDRDGLKSYGDRLSGRIAELEELIHTAAGCDFNINSPKQLGEVLFEQMGLPGGKKTKTGYSTAADVLEKLAPSAPIVRDILEYRGLAKLKSTYADGLYDFIGPDGRIHTSFHQTITATGRISSAEPNLQNIPMRTALGREIRKVFVPEDGYIFADADYSQIELRILAAMSGDEALIRAYHENRDIHAITASKVFGVPFDEVTPLQRRNAKAVNFGIVYGISSFGLSQDLSITRTEAADYIKQYFETYPGVKSFLDRQVADAKKKGYAVTLFGRRRPVPELKNSNFAVRGFGERVAMNAPIQGTAADIMKIAMIRVWARLRREKLDSRMILQIHDELLIETAPGEKEQVERILTEEMMGAADLPVPLEVECCTGTDWFEAK